MVKEIYSITLKEQCAEAKPIDLKVQILAEGGQLWLQPAGYGEKNVPDGEGWPVGLEIWQGRLRLLVFADINSEEPRIIDLEKARETARIPELDGSETEVLVPPVENAADLATLSGFMWDGGFIVLGINHQDKQTEDRYEAWAYQGPLDFQEAVPVTFGRGRDVRVCLLVLSQQIAQSRDIGKRKPMFAGLFIAPPPLESGSEPLWRVVYTIDVNAPDARSAAESAYRIMTDPESWAPVLDVIDPQGRVIRVDLCEEPDNIRKGGD